MAKTGKGARRDGIRLFIALDPPVAARLASAEWGKAVARRIPGLTPIGPETIHLTLAFLGSMPADSIEHLVSAIEGVARPVPALETGACVWLPKRRPRALALELDERTGGLDSLRGDLIREIGRETDWSSNRTGFLPHLTVARAARSFRVPAEIPVPVPTLRFEPDSITLFRSLLEPSGARYEPLFVLPLPPSPADEGHPQGA